MATVTQPCTTVQFDTALRTLAAQAATRYAGEAARIERGLVIALNGGVTLQADGTARVQSQCNAEVVYAVNGHCDCKDAAHGAPDGRCKHRWAKTLTSRASRTEEPTTETLDDTIACLYGDQAAAREAQHAATQRPTAAPAAARACPEAAFSLTLKGLLDGQDALLTVRGQTPEEFTTNLQAVRGLFDTPAASQPSQPSAPDQPAALPEPEPTTRECPVHPGVLMVEQHNARGAWWSHKTAEGWCKGKGKGR